MKKISLLILLMIPLSVVNAQSYTSANVFSHNDYYSKRPFYDAWELQTGFVEADVFLWNGQLLVGHTIPELHDNRTLENLYLQPLYRKIKENGGFPYPETKREFTLMIDLKTEGTSTLREIVHVLKKYPELTTAPLIHIVISGNVPSPERWGDFPSYIKFDGRPQVAYTTEQLKRVHIVSTNFGEYSLWNGKGVLTSADRKKIDSLRDAVHAMGKPLRFWNAPDISNAWMIFMDLGIDILGTDNVSGLVKYLHDKEKNAYQNSSFHDTYTPQFEWKNSIPKNIVLMIGDGMGLAQIYAGFTANRGDLNIFKCVDIGLAVTVSGDSYITDSAAGATAMATGQKTNNRHVGVDAAGYPLPSILTEFRQAGMRTALISNGDVTDATPASFYAHQAERNMSEKIALDFVENGSDILIGAGIKSFANRSDDSDLFSMLREKAYITSSALQALDTINSARFVVIDDSAALAKKEGRDDFLEQSFNACVRNFEKSEEPFFIMLEAAQIDWGGHANDMEYVVREVLDFDKVVGEVLKFADEDGETLVIVTADHETGGLSLTGGSIEKGFVWGNFSSTDHTAIMVPVFAYGPGSELFKGVYQNTAIYHKILELIRAR